MLGLLPCKGYRAHSSLAVGTHLAHGKGQAQLKVLSVHLLTYSSSNPGNCFLGIPHLTDHKTEAQKAQETCPKHPEDWSESWSLECRRIAPALISWEPPHHPAEVSPMMISIPQVVTLRLGNLPDVNLGFQDLLLGGLRAKKKVRGILRGKRSLWAGVTGGRLGTE